MFPFFVVHNNWPVFMFPFHFLLCIWKRSSEYPFIVEIKAPFKHLDFEVISQINQLPLQFRNATVPMHLCVPTHHSFADSPKSTRHFSDHIMLLTPVVITRIMTLLTIHILYLWVVHLWTMKTAVSALHVLLSRQGASQHELGTLW